MNYIKAINAFYDHQEFNPLSSAAINLWHSLMHVNNKSRWKKEFSASMTVLCVKTNLSESSIRKAREELAEKGYVTFTSRSGNKKPIYRITPLYEETANANDTLEENSGGKSNGSDSGKWNTLSKQKATKQKEVVVERQAENPPHFYETTTGTLSPSIAEIPHYCEKSSEDLVMKSMELAVETNNTSSPIAKAFSNSGSKRESVP